MVRAKFQCMSITKRKGWDAIPFVYDAEFSAVTKHSNPVTREIADENAAFFAATPAGSVKLSTVRADHFEVGRDYYLEFTPV
jgi:hypothetical protein